MQQELAYDLKTCTRCQESKSLDSFRRGQGYKDGIRSICKVCEADRLTRWRQEHPGQAQAQWNRSNASRRNRKMGYYNPDPEARTLVAMQRRDAYLKRKYGITLDDELRMLAEQDYLCAVCAESIAETHHVDHCHKTGKVRALLCGRCNVALGSAGDDPVLLRKLADYADAHV